jgi:GntR family transcriptional regulator/MocR family aminotransferase
VKRVLELPLDLDTDDSLPLYVRIARSLAAEIRRGRLAPGAALPGTRSLATALGVHRNTALAAYAELVAEGWAGSRPGGGTFVSESLPERLLRGGKSFSTSAGLAREPAFALVPDGGPSFPMVEPPAEFVMMGGVPDLRLLPHTLLTRAYRRALERHARGLLDYGAPEGEPRLRAALAALVARRRGIAARAENVLVTRGSQMALDLVARALCGAGDAVAIEAIGYRPAWRAFFGAGARLVPIPVDRSGLVISELAKAARRERIRAVYVTPHHQYPTTAVLAPGRRMELLALAGRERFAIIEDDYDHEFHYDGRPVLPLASMDSRGSVVYIGTLSKILAPGLRIGFLVAPERLIVRLARERFVIDRQGDHALEAAIAELIEDGEIDRHVRKMQRVYRSRRDALLESLARRLDGRFEPVRPGGGMALWGRVLGGADVECWRERALARGVLFTTARQYSFDGRARPYARLGYAALSEQEISEAVRRLAAVWPPARRNGGGSD